LSHIQYVDGVVVGYVVVRDSDVSVGDGCVGIVDAGVVCVDVYIFRDGVGYVCDVAVDVIIYVDVVDDGVVVIVYVVIYVVVSCVNGYVGVVVIVVGVVDGVVNVGVVHVVVRQHIQ